ncbi:MAG: hypothetical protein JWM62_2096 [Frankiales bacterium]|nr:hypothetical protein [Frankiales bacterium]
MRPPGPGVRQAALALLLLGGLVLAVVQLGGDWSTLREGAAELSLPYVLAAFLMVLLSLTLSLLTWRATLAGLGTPLPLGTAARIFFVGQLGKYVPGSVWPVLAQMELGSAYGLSRTAVGTASLLQLAVGIPGALLIGALAVPALVSAGAGAYALLLLVLPLAVLALWPPVLGAALDRGLRLLRRPPLTQRLTGRVVLQVALLSAASGVLLGLQAWLLAVDLGARGTLLLPLATGAFVLAMAAGLLALPLPAGAGVREAVLVAALSSALPLGQALLLALVSRVLLTVADLTVAAAAAAGRRRPAS